MSIANEFEPQVKATETHPQPIIELDVMRRRRFEQTAPDAASESPEYEHMRSFATFEVVSDEQRAEFRKNDSEIRARYTLSLETVTTANNSLTTIRETDLDLAAKKELTAEQTFEARRAELVEEYNYVIRKITEDYQRKIQKAEFEMKSNDIDVAEVRTGANTFVVASEAARQGIAVPTLQGLELQRQFETKRDMLIDSHTNLVKRHTERKSDFEIAQATVAITNTLLVENEIAKQELFVVEGELLTRQAKERKRLEKEIRADVAKSYEETTHVDPSDQLFDKDEEQLALEAEQARVRAEVQAELIAVKLENALRSMKSDDLVKVRTELSLNKDSQLRLERTIAHNKTIVTTNELLIQSAASELEQLETSITIREAEILEHFSKFGNQIDMQSQKMVAAAKEFQQMVRGNIASIGTPSPLLAKFYNAVIEHQSTIATATDREALQKLIPSTYVNPEIVSDIFTAEEAEELAAGISRLKTTDKGNQTFESILSVSEPMDSMRDAVDATKEAVSDVIEIAKRGFTRKGIQTVLQVVTRKPTSKD